MIIEWRDIPGYEGQYMISNTGAVKGLKRLVEYSSPLGNKSVTILKERILRPYFSSGYLKVDLYKNSERRKVFVHLLVAGQFVLNPNNKPQVNHKDGNRANPVAENLEWTTQAENVDHAKRVLGRTFNSHPPRGKDSPYAIPVIQLDLGGNVIREWGALAEIKREKGFKGSHISDCCKGKLNSIYGFRWQFKNVI